MPGKTRKTRQGKKRIHKPLQFSDKGHPILWVDEEEWRGWPKCKVCGRLVRRDWNGEKGRSRWLHHEGCRLVRRGTSEWLGGGRFKDDPPEQIEANFRAAKVEWNYKYRMGQL